MSNELDIDTNIDNYTDNELLDIIGLDDNADQDYIKKRIDKIINNYTINNKQQYAKFFIDAKKKLLTQSSPNNNNWSDSNNHAEYLLQNQYILPNKDQNIVNRNKGTKIIDSTTAPVTIKEQLNINNSIPLSVAQDSLNPTLRQTTSRIITIDSQYRPNKRPYNPNPLSKTSSTLYSCTLSERLKNVLQLKLTSLYIPKTWYTFDYFNQNTTFLIKKNAVLDSSHIAIQISDGNYTEDGLINEINNQIHKQNDISCIDVGFFNTNTSNKIIKFTNNSQDVSFTVIFYSNLFTFFNKNSCNNIFSPTHNLGYYLGIRIAKLTNAFTQIIL